MCVCVCVSMTVLLACADDIDIMCQAACNYESWPKINSALYARFLYGQVRARNPLDSLCNVHTHTHTYIHIQNAILYMEITVAVAVSDDVDKFVFCVAIDPNWEHTNLIMAQV